MPSPPANRGTCGGCLFGLGILHVGAGVAKALARHFATLDQVFAASAEQLTETEDIGEVIARSIVDWHGEPENRKLIERLSQAGLNFKSSLYQPAAKAGPFAGKTFVLTGTLPTLTREDSHGENRITRRQSQRQREQKNGFCSGRRRSRFQIGQGAKARREDN